MSQEAIALGLKSRYEWVDVAKSIGLYLMVIGHMSLLSPHWTKIIYTFHMPIFFVLSGMLHTNKDFKQTLNKVWRSLILPYLIIATSWCIYYTIMNFKHVGSISLFNQLVHFYLGTFISPGHPFGPLDSYCIYIWFLLALAWIKILATRLFSNLHFVVSSLGCILIFIVIKYNSVQIPFAIDSALLAFPFYAIGFVSKPYLMKAMLIDSARMMILLLVIPFFLSFSRLNGEVDICKCLYGDNLGLFYLWGCVGSYIIITLSKSKVAQQKAIGAMGGVIAEGSLIIVGYSAFLSGIICKLFACLKGSNVGGLIIGVLTISLLVPLILICRKYFPAILGKNAKKNSIK